MKKIFFFLAICIFLISFVSASNPQHHLSLQERVCRESNPTRIQQVACNNFDAFVMGNIVVDWTVPFYFNSFVKYSNSHSPSLCQNLVSLASTERELAFAYGSCTHDIQDSISHNRFVPPVIEKVKLTNAMIHALAEEAENDILLERDPGLRSRLDSILIGNQGTDIEEFPVEEFIPLYLEAVQGNPIFQDENIAENINFLFTQISKGGSYEHGFRTAFVVPIEIWVILSLVFLVSFIGLIALIFKREKNILTWITVVFVLPFFVLSVLAFIGLFSGNLFTTYQSISAPITNILPIGNWEADYELQVENTIRFFNEDIDFMAVVDDPTGIEALKEAGKAGLLTRTIIGIIFVAIIGLLIYANFFFKRKKQNG